MLGRPTMHASIWLANTVLVVSMMLLLWLWSLVRRDASVVDPWWSMGFLFVFVRTAVATSGTALTPGKWVVLVVTALWAVRLWAHLAWRSRGKPEDPRYTAFRRKAGRHFWWTSLFQVFLLQAALMLVISAPLALAGAAAAPDPVRWNDELGAGLAFVGFVIETLADAQLTRFRNDPAERGKVMDRGLWRYSRHPNYFGETLVMWGLWLCAIDQPWGLAAVVAPVLMTFMLLRVSGVTMLEKQLSGTKPEYVAYVKATSAFVPLPPRR
jgi:steroid 5-alpha reductase family enzyme